MHDHQCPGETQGLATLRCRVECLLRWCLQNIQHQIAKACRRAQETQLGSVFAQGANAPVGPGLRGIEVIGFAADGALAGAQCQRLVPARTGGRESWKIVPIGDGDEVLLAGQLVAEQRGELLQGAWSVCLPGGILHGARRRIVMVDDMHSLARLFEQQPLCPSVGGFFGAGELDGDDVAPKAVDVRVLDQRIGEDEAPASGDDPHIDTQLPGDAQNGGAFEVVAGAK
jgi:hypothetical protein